jgi:hypothetical protein
MDGLQEYRVTLKECIDDKFTIVFDCWAEDTEHAYEQAEDMYNGSILLNATIKD